MLALPSATERTSLLLALVIGLPAALLTAWFLRRRLLEALPASSGRTGVVWTIVLAAFVAVASAPSTAWRISEDVRYTSGISRSVAERIGAYENFLDATIFDDVVHRLPPDATYHVRVARSVPKPLARASFRGWALTALLPRRAVVDPAEADWILSWGVDPRTLGVATREVEMLRPPKYGFPAVYLAATA